MAKANLRISYDMYYQFEIGIELENVLCTLKSEISKLCGISMARQSLLFQGSILKDDFRDLNSYGITDGSEIQLVVNPGAKRTAKVTCVNCGESDHDAKNCFERPRNPENPKPKPKEVVHVPTAETQLGQEFSVKFGRSGVHGVAVSGVEGEPVNLTELVSEAIAAGFAAWLLDKKKSDLSGHMRVSIGHDSRISASKLQDAVSRGLASTDFNVVQYGLASTPAMFKSTLTEDKEALCPVDGAIMITASHLPFNRNGFKFFTNAGPLDVADIEDVLMSAFDIHSSFTAEGVAESQRIASTAVRSVDYMKIYASDLVKVVRKAAGNIEKPLDGLHIIIDAGNGAGGFFSAKVLEPLGAITTGSQFLNPDGSFPNHIPNPDDKNVMDFITQAVLHNKADLGIMFDGDVDRCSVVDSKGRELNGNHLIAIMSAIVLQEHPGTIIVTDSLTSDGLTTFIEKKLGGKHHPFKKGFKKVIGEAIRLNSVGEESYLAIETGGHGAFEENHWLDDGAYLMVKLLCKLASARASGLSGGSKVLTDLVEGLEDPGATVDT